MIVLNVESVVDISSFVILSSFLKVRTCTISWEGKNPPPDIICFFTQLYKDRKRVYHCLQPLSLPSSAMNSLASRPVRLSFLPPTGTVHFHINIDICVARFCGHFSALSFPFPLSSVWHSSSFSLTLGSLTSVLLLCLFSSSCWFPSPLSIEMPQNPDLVSVFIPSLTNLLSCSCSYCIDAETPKCLSPPQPLPRASGSRIDLPTWYIHLTPGR